MHLSKLKFSVTLFTLIFFVSCETPNNNQNSSIRYSEPANLGSNKIIDNILPLEAFEENKDLTKKKNLNVVLMLPLSGKNYQIGQSLLNSAHLAVDKINNNKIILRVIDTGNEEKILIRLYSLLENDIDIVIGPVFTEEINRVKEIIKSKNIPMLALSNNSKLQEEKLYVFGLTLEDEIRQLLEYSLQNNLKKYAVIIPDNEFGSRVQTEIKKFSSMYDSLSFNFNFYDSEFPNFYEISRSVSNFEERKINLENKILILEKQNSERAKKELKKLKKLDTYGEVDFEAIIIFAQNFQEISNFSSILPYYDVDPKKIQYIGNSLWSKNLALKEPGLTNGYFTSLDINSRRAFEDSYIEIFNYKPHTLSTLIYDIVGLISKLHKEESSFSTNKFHSPSGFIGINGWFKLMPEGKVLRKPKIYKIKNQNFVPLN